MTTKTFVIGGAVVALLIAGCLIEHWNDRRMIACKSSPAWRTWLPVVLLVLLAIGMVLSVRKVSARDVDGRYAASPLKQWFDGLRSGRGPCCSDADGYALSDVDWEAKDGRYRVRIPRSNDAADKDALIWVDVPEDAVITEPNRAGRTMVWPIWGWQGPQVRCFMPGSMT